MTIIDSRIRSDIAALSQSPRNSREDAKQHANATNWIVDEFEKIGLEVTRQKFEIPEQTPARTGTNVIGTLNPSSTEAPVLIGAHYDTVPGSPGADDNASGVAAMIECARVLTEAPSTRKVIFAAFDAEEMQSPVQGLHGSTAYVAELADQQRPTAAIILESIGFSSSTIKQSLPSSFKYLFKRAYQALQRQKFEANSLLILSKGKGRQISRHFEQIARNQDIQLPILPLEVPWWMPQVRNLRRSDHAPFWKAGIPAVMISDTANFRNPNYHQPTDTIETIDITLVAKATRMIVDAINQDAI